MASNNNQGHVPGQDPSIQRPIPLQNLSRDETDDFENIDERRGRRRSSGARSGHGPRRSLLTGGGFKTYERVAEDSPSPKDRVGLRITQPSTARFKENNPYAPDDHDFVEDPGGFAEAMGSIGFGFRSSSPRRPDSEEFMMSSFSGPSGHGGRVNPDDYFSSPTVPIDDTAPLTDKKYLQPISGATAEEPEGRASMQSIRLGNSYSSSRLGDDLETGAGGKRRGSSSPGGSPSRSRSLSPSVSGSALHRAGTVMQMMSQRVVNLSNEPVEQAILRRESMKKPRQDEPSSPGQQDSTGIPHRTESMSEKGSTQTTWRTHVNPFKGKSLGIFSPDNPLRTWLCDILVYPATEPFILLVIVVHAVLLTVQSAHSVWTHPRSERWGSQPIDYALFVIFVIYTIELSVRIIVSGFIWNAAEYSTLDRSLGIKKAISERGKSLLSLQRGPSTKKKSVTFEDSQPSYLRKTFTGLQPFTDTSDDPRHGSRKRLAYRAFLRHSFNRLDFLAVISYWISFGLQITGYSSKHDIYIFQMLSCLRLLRLLGITDGTSVILRSLKKAAPLLVHVAFLIGFFWLLFAIVGIQSFKSSFRRSCVWIDPAGQNNFTMNDPYNVIQLCGGYLDSVTGEAKPWVYANNEPSLFSPKGYLCPQGSMCIEGSNPYNGTMSFDNIFNSLELVFVIMSSNTFTDLLYYTTDSDYLASALFFAIGFVLLSLWMVNLLVAVITSSFQVIREESKQSAFAMEKLEEPEIDELGHYKVNHLKVLYEKTRWLWIVLIAYDLIVQCLRSASMSHRTERFISVTETAVTFALLLEIILRFASDWRHFHHSKRNIMDLALAVITCIIQIPPIHSSGRAYSALTLFQILRVYRIVLAFSVTRDLIMVVFRNVVGLLNLILFVFLMTYLAAIFAVQLFRGVFPAVNDSGNTIDMSFFTIYNSFLAMYQILSSENWTTILYGSTTYTKAYGTSWISASFIVMWFILSCFIILNMFIAVIQESFDVSEDQKRLHQVKAFLQQKELGSSSASNLALTSIFKFGRNNARYREPLDYGPATMEMLLKDAVVQEFLDEHFDTYDAQTPHQSSVDKDSVQPGLLSIIWTKISKVFLNKEPNPFYSKLKFSKAYDELDPRTLAKEVVMASEQRKVAQREYLQRYPLYNKSLYLFGPHNPIRRACQRIVGPGRGNHRFEGVEPYKPLWYTFSAFIYACIVAMVLLACITTPLYQRDYFLSRQYTPDNWFVWTDAGFAAVFTVEAMIKVIADGFFWTPNAYFRSSWGFLDGIVLITLWINVFTSLFTTGSVSRIVGAFKALRALRLLNVSDSARDTFHSVIIVGGWKVISAAFVSLSFLIPFAIYGLNLFNGQMISCNDNNLSGSLDGCIGEYQSSPFNWNVLAPRVADNSYYSFDNFGESLFILFQIVSQEGWIDVQSRAMSITGVGQQLQNFASQANGLFFVIFNLLGAVFVLTLFVTVFMRNYTEQTGVAFLTAEQRSWLELRKLLRQISPSKRSNNAFAENWRKTCYRLASRKNGKWAHFITTLLVFHLLLLTLEWYPYPAMWDLIRDVLFFILTLFYIADITIRIIGLGWPRFRRSSWDLYSLLSVPGTFLTVILAFIFRDTRGMNAIPQLNKLFIVSVTLLIIPRNNQLDQLFKTAAASLTSIVNLLATWFVLFLVFAIAMTQTFGLTKFGDNETNNLNFRDVPNALIFLFRTSAGEGWNELMEDFASMKPPYCTLTDEFLDSDCGSEGWARGLFIAWNVISMYLFVSLFVSLIFESFSYVYQRSSGLGLYTIDRDEIRRFKEAWANFDPDGTGFITKEHFPRLLGELSGVFEMRIYDGDFTVGRILEKCRTGPNPRDSLVSFNPGERPGSNEVDIAKLARIINRIPVEEIRARRKRLNIFYEEVLVSADPERGVSFSACLMILAHYKIIVDSKSLRLEEFLRRRTRLRRVEEAVRRNTVMGFFDTLHWARQFRKHIESRKSARLTAVPQFSIPEIFVDDQEHQGTEDDPFSDEPSPQKDSRMTLSSPTSLPKSLSPTSSTRPSLQIDTNITAEGSSSEWSRIGAALSPRQNAPDLNLDFPDGSRSLGGQSSEGGHSRDNSVIVQDMMQTLGDSAWGESIRRSFTQRRSGSHQ
ncbi:calcium channel subunit Cch1 [Talaromyces stipitatus ATCC 10500]|uniref:Calcium-channel protein CCH1 n=1 Tax=Talaromyces stipitatus (strain ATCC 10500 / CBS 375.48 / QM 6759 / NRRL 1006) TaxID=441959 RepID=B8LVP1_TALSN|nr:calcium channel subunit Cch1 [Talaromyces stipitatus ATCC 10500]EED24171.1 calcium channel subunit Cch1 [Talaromyces stipitatus ATCC 10500]